MPLRGGLSDDCRIICEAADGEHVVIKGSERITGWCHDEGTVWKVCIDNAFFHGFNPYIHPVKGDWIVGPFHKERSQFSWDMGEGAGSGY